MADTDMKDVKHEPVHVKSEPVLVKSEPEPVSTLAVPVTLEPVPTQAKHVPMEVGGRSKRVLDDINLVHIVHTVKETTTKKEKNSKTLASVTMAPKAQEKPKICFMKLDEIVVNVINDYYCGQLFYEMKPLKLPLNAVSTFLSANASTIMRTYDTNNLTCT